MPKIVQYSPDPSIMPYFRAHWFMYNPEDWWIGITSMNRLRKFTESLGVTCASRNIILAILKHSEWEILWNAINTHGHISVICRVNIQKYRETVFWALLSWSIDWHLTQLWISPEFTQQVHPVMRKPRRNGGGTIIPSPVHQQELLFSE